MVRSKVDSINFIITFFENGFTDFFNATPFCSLIGAGVVFGVGISLGFRDMGKKPCTQ